MVALTAENLIGEKGIDARRIIVTDVMDRLARMNFKIAVELSMLSKERQEKIKDLPEDVKKAITDYVEAALLAADHDCQHTAAAILAGCDIITSWNFRHIVNVKTVPKVKTITTPEGEWENSLWRANGRRKG